MGSFFTKLQSRKIKVDKQLLNASGSKLRQYFCSFRSICQDFTIRVPDYMQIFGSNVKSFDVWDPERTGIIDAMEMFAGLIVFSNVAYEDKIKFLYQIFDLNQEGFLEYDELVFMFINVVEATFKIYQLQPISLNDTTIKQYLDEFFSDQTQLKYQDFIRWSYRTDEIIQFFAIIGHPFQPQINAHTIDEYDESNSQSKRVTNFGIFNYKAESKIKVKIDQRFLNVIKNDHILLQQQSSQQKQQQFNPLMKWIYGIRIDDIRYPLHYRKTQYYKAANQKFLYICGKNVIVLYPKLNIQKNYTNHKQPVSCIQISQCNSIVASGEMGLYPSIHLWQLRTTKCLLKFDKVHKNSIKMLRFFHQNQLLITVGGNYNSSLVIINIKTKEKLLSTYLIEPVLNIIFLKQDHPQHQFYMILPTNIVKCKTHENIGYSLNYQKIIITEQPESNQQQIRIRTATQIKTSSQPQPSIILVYNLNSLALYNPIQNKTTLLKSSYNRRITKKTTKTMRDRERQKTKKIKIVDEQKDDKIVDVFTSGSGERLYVLYEKRFSVCDIDADYCLNCKFEVADIPSNLFNLELIHLVEVNQDCVLLVSLMGDVFKVSNFQSQPYRSIQPQPKIQADQKLNSIKIIQNTIQQDEGDYSDCHNEPQSNPSNNSHLCPQTEPQTKKALQFHKYCQIFKLQAINGVCFLSKENYQINPQCQKPKLVIASGSLIYIIDQVEKELLSLQCLEQNIVHIHSVGNTYAVATELKYLMILRDGITVQKAKCSDNSSNSLINGFKINNDNLIVSIDQQIFIYFKSGGNYLDREPRKIKIDHGIPIHLSTTSTPKIFLVITRQKSMLKLNTQSKQKIVISAKQLNCDFLQSYYPQVGTTKSPILFSGTRRLFLLAQPNGDIHFWNSLTHMIKNQQSYSTLTAHCSPVTQLVFFNGGFVSAGESDGQLVIWENQDVIAEIEVDTYHEHEQVSTFIETGKPKVKFPDDPINQVSKVKQQITNIKVNSQLYVQEITVLDKFVCDSVPLKDSQVEIIVKDGQLYKDISKNINHILMPNNTEMFEPLVDKRKNVNKSSFMQQDRNKYKNVIKLKQRLSLNFNGCYIYGFNSQKTRNSLFYIHQHTEPQHKPPKKPTPPRTQHSQKSNQIEFVNQLLLPINQIHSNCKRSFFYFTGKFGIIWSPLLKNQFNYDFHTNRITCAAVHPRKNLVATAQISNLYPIVHVWNADSLTMLHSFKTKHNRFVSRIQFSRDGDFIVSLGGPAFQQSIQIYNWVREQTICYRFVQQTCYYDIKFNPYNFNQIAACGFRSLCIMNISNRTLIKKQQATITQNQQITCMIYTSSIYGNTIESDIITGSSNGDISLFICGKYITCKKQAHEKSINCLKLCQLFKYKTIVISAAEDHMIKFWDTKFNQITFINVKEIPNLHKTVHQHSKLSFAPQSIDVYQCFGDQDGKGYGDGDGQGEVKKQVNYETILLVGTRNGCIFEAKICNEYQGLKLYISKNPLANQQQHRPHQRTKVNFMDSMPENHTQPKQQSITNQHIQMKNSQISQKLQLNYICHFNNLPSTFNRSVMFDIDIKRNLMITYARVSQFFTLWNIEKRQVIKIHKLTSYPSCIKFSRTNFVGVCYLDGRIEFLEIDASYQFILREQKIFVDWDYQPNNIIFSQNDTKIAVIFSKQQQQKRLSNNINSTLTDQSSPSEGQQILMIYQRVFNSQNAPFNSSDKNTHSISNEKRKFKNIFWCDFCAGGQKLLICYTLNFYQKLNNSNRKRMMGSFQTSHHQPLYQYVLYDVGKRVDKEMTNEQFHVLNFSPAIKAKYSYYNNCKIIEEYQANLQKPRQFDSPYQTQKRSKLLSTNQQRTLLKTTNSFNTFSPQTHTSFPQSSQPSGQNQANMNMNISGSNNATGNQITEQFVPICQMAQYQKLTLMGTIYGEIFAVSSDSFYVEGGEEVGESLRVVAKAKCFAVFDSPISNMQVVGDRIYVSGKDCGTIVEFNVSIFNSQDEEQQPESQLKNNQPNQIINQNQKFYESFSKQKIQNWLKYVFPKRKNFYETKLNCEDRKNIRQTNNSEPKSTEKEDEITLQPYHIIGRNAFYKRNNVLIDLKDNLITFSGCNLLIMSAHPDKGHKFQQQFLKLDNTVFTVNPQISTITMSKDKRTLFAGTTQENCQLIIWDISTRTQRQHICFKGYVSVILVKVSEKQRHAVVLVLNQDAEQIIFFVSLTNFEILASFNVSGEAYICDFDFFPGNQFKFLACGVNYIAEWTFKGGLLDCQKYIMKKNNETTDLNNQNNAKKIFITFYSIIFLKDVAITGGSDGYLYMWGDQSLLKKQNANPKAAILTLFASKNSKIFASGGVDGKAIIWQLGSSSIIQKVFQFSIYSGKQIVIPSKYHIQSVIIGTNQIFIGTRSGQIHRYEFISNQTTQFEQNHNNTNQSKQNHSLILSAFDNDQINSCSFNISSQKLYVLTQSGTFSVFNLLTNQKIKEEKIRIDNTEIVKMLVCKLSAKIYVILKKSIEVYTYIEEGKYSNRFSKLKETLKSGSSEIKAGILSLNQKYLALLMSPNHLQNAKIEIYDMTQQDNKQFYVQYKVLQNIPANIEVIDFSTDNGYLVFKNSDQDQTIIDLTTKQTINTKQIQFELEWSQQAKKTSKYIRDICSTYSDENKLKTILQIMNHSVIVSDEMGSLRVFRYEQNIEENLIEYYGIYLEHLNDVHLCIVSADCTILVTVGKYDRSIVLWKVKNFDMLAAKTGKKKIKAIAN